MEGFAAEPVRGHQEVHRGPDHQDQLKRREFRKRKDLFEQTQHDIGSGRLTSRMHWQKRGRGNSKGRGPFKGRQGYKQGQG